MAMSPREVYDAWNEQIDTGQSAAFQEVLASLRRGELVMEFPPEGTLIRVATPEELAAAQPHAYMGDHAKGESCQYGGPDGVDSGVTCGRSRFHPLHQG